jgi:murein DD-endopeptidase MepM/ murein hydrolase activator NlpD
MRLSLLRAAFASLLIGSLAPAVAWCADAPPRAELRESFDMQVPVAPSPVTVEGRVRLHYELHLTNFAAAPLRPTALEIVDTGSGFPVARFAGDALGARIALVGPPDEAQLQGAVPAGRRAVLYVELDLSSEALPSALAHRLVYAREDGGEDTVAGPEVAVEKNPLPVLGPPLRGGPWVVIYDAAWARGHRRVFYAVEGRARLPGRFATDWVRVDEAGHTERGDADLARSALGYGAEAIAVADATVVAVRNDYPEQARVSANPKHAISDASGNHVVLDLGDGRYAFYEHLRPGSVRVAAGARVRRGQVLGELGFTGDSTGPHLHFHVADGPSPVAAEGRPFAFDRFRVLGRYDDLSRLGSAPWTPRAKDRPAVRERELPEGNSVVELGTTR